MSKALKVYTRPDNPGYSRPSPQGCYVKPAIQVPIEDESLPHPGDGKIWMRHGDQVEIMGIPVDASTGNTRVMCRYVKGGGLTIQYAEDLRERQPEPEHDARCQRYRDHYGRKDCICEERRSGEDRRS